MKQEIFLTDIKKEVLLLISQYLFKRYIQTMLTLR